MPRSRQVRHSLQVLASAWRLRGALAESRSSQSQEDIMMTRTHRPIRCRLGRHHWHWTSTTDGERYECCVRCGRDRTEQVAGSYRMGWGANVGG